MLKNLLQERIIHKENTLAYFSHQLVELSNDVDVLGIQATTLQIQDQSIVASYIVDDKIYLKSLRSGETIITLINQKNKAFIKLTVLNSGGIVTEITPCLKNKKIVPVYFKRILGATAVAVDLKGALIDYLISEEKIYEDSLIEEVHYQSLHPNVISHSVNGRFILGCHANGLPLTNSQEYALANRVATLKFSKIAYRHNGVKITLEEELLITFMITDEVKDI
ncbi:hypothetical protein P9B03_05900 [Metasolibacillus meyeri]|uniref:Uncharacterized protein n=1 Tax=Metasolibacillus meyeri TaxID=1071052 RepID=A0AAW9NND3_9BACL|nr:hypothetical protein [Metasolibacillus meyeri]MEC1178011.1 hypothetical protein [Metasolibacillus meyeri]